MSAKIVVIVLGVITLTIGIVMKEGCVTRLISTITVSFLLVAVACSSEETRWRSTAQGDRLVKP